VCAISTAVGDAEKNRLRHGYRIRHTTSITPIQSTASAGYPSDVVPSTAGREPEQLQDGIEAQKERGDARADSIVA
jgi:hypothetical protein